MEALLRFDPTARMNIMEIDPRLPAQEPVFKTVYALGMDRAEDADLGLLVSQGVAGRAVAEGDFTAADLTVEGGPDSGLSEDQRHKTKALTLVLSVPIKKTERLPDGTPSVTDEVLGVVNVDSRMERALRRYREQPDPKAGTLLGRQEGDLGDISELCSYIMS